MNGLYWLMLQIFLSLLKEAAAGMSELPYLLLSGPTNGTRSTWPLFTDWSWLGTSKPSTSSSRVQIMYSLCHVVPERTQAVTDGGLHLLGNPKACAPSGELQTTSEHHHSTTPTNDTLKVWAQQIPEPWWSKYSVEWAPPQLILHGGWRLVVSGHSQCLQLTGLGKSLPFMCQQQSRLNYKRRMYSVHMEDAPLKLSLGDKEAVPLDPTGHLLH